jgi:photosystem II stability/assembly factor-like uncharacterized protein
VTHYEFVKRLLWITCILATPGCALNNKSETRAPLLQAQVEIPSAISGNESPQWAAVSTNLEDAGELRAGQFLSASHGWIVSEKGFPYKTTDGGRTWQQVKAEALANIPITGLFFVSNDLGWLVQRDKNESRLINTTDSGQTWQAQYSLQRSNIKRVRFASAEEGWAVGIRFSGSNDTPSGSSVILYTSDQGKHWTDMSENLRRVTSDNHLTDVYAVAPSKALVLTSGGTVISTEDGGRNWRQVIDIPDKPQTFFSRLGISGGNQLWALGGADSTEGMWGLLVHIEAEKAWKKFRVECFLNDAVFLSEDEIYVCGHMRTDAPHFPEVGVILHSTDGGHSWRIVHRIQGSSIKAMSLVNSNLIYAISDNGLFLRLEPSKNSSNQVN